MQELWGDGNHDRKSGPKVEDIPVLVSVCCCLFILFLFLSELTGFIATEIVNELYVDDPDKDSGGKIEVNLNISLPNLHCELVGLDIQDEMGRHEVGHIDNSMKIPLNNGDGCRFEGHFSINKVPGNFHVSTHSATAQPQNPDMTHVIHKLSFGDKLQVHNVHGAFNALEGADKLSSNRGPKYLRLSLRVCEGELHRRGDEYVAYSHTGRIIPAIWFRYDLSPITVKYTERRQPLYRFITSICAIIGGTFTVAGILDSCIFTASEAWKKIQLGKMHMFFSNRAGQRRHLQQIKEISMHFRALRGKNQWNQGVDSLPPEREVEMPFEIQRFYILCAQKNSAALWVDEHSFLSCFVCVYSIHLSNTGILTLQDLRCLPFPLRLSQASFLMLSHRYPGQHSHRLTLAGSSIPELPCPFLQALSSGASKTQSCEGKTPARGVLHVIWSQKRQQMPTSAFSRASSEFLECISEEFLIVEIVSLLWSREGAASFIHPPKSSSQLLSPCHAMPCSHFRQHWNFSLSFSGLIALALGANWIVELPVPVHVWVDFFLLFIFPPFTKMNFFGEMLVFTWGVCVPVPVSGTPWMWDFPWQLLLLLAEGFPLIHCDQLKLTAKISSFFLLDLVSLC
ncbi:hypothetical protein EK904_006532 [Melospiza melodia maxima]|nr:hypothetical protein EK904_006532 [Melospiza melodia maxima]